MHEQSAKYNLYDLQPQEESKWDNFIDSNSLPIFFSLKWARIIRDTTNRPYKVLLIEKNGQIFGGFLHWPHKKYGLDAVTPPPFTPYFGTILNLRANTKNSTLIARHQQCNDLLIKELKKRFDFIRFLGHPLLADIRPYLWNGFDVQPLYTYRFPLKHNVDMQYNTTLKRQIRKSERENLSLQSNTEPDALVRFVLDSYLAHGLNPPLDEQALQVFSRALLKEGIARLFYVLNSSGEKIGGMLLTHDANTVYYSLSGINRAYKHLNPMVFLLDRVFRDKRLSGKEFDFIGANTPVLEQFKRGFGGRLVTYFHLSFYKNALIKNMVRLNDLRLKHRTGRG
ncbi:MAG TPA: GNAT family N-acetyltransferase [Calditrichaeota bacterium]|nr:GNAT family N-acetyltransferase [Calditrichota bacterium]